MFDLSNFDSIQIGIASPEKIREWSYGEVTKPETINYRTQKPEKDGLFCERIFGPQKDWECHCGKYKRIRNKGIICDKCGVEVTRAKVRRERMGHIELAAPVCHIWYFRGVPSRMGFLLDMSPKLLEQVLCFSSYVVLDPGKTEFVYKQVLSANEYKDACENKYKDIPFKVGMGAEAIKELLMEVDLEKESNDLKEIILKSTGQKRVRAIKRIEIVEAFRKSGNRPEWMILDVLPVLPPELRPMVQLDGGRYATSDLNDLYRRVINRNNRLKKLIEINAPNLLIINEKRMLQESVDNLIDNDRTKRPHSSNKRELKSLTGMLKGKQGRFRQNLLGKRVDYSGRSVIVVGPELKLHQCGLPKEMALELFKPFVMKKLVDEAICQNIKGAKKKIERADDKVWDILEDVIKDHPVLLNRAPTLHRLSIQAFEPILIEGRAIKLHPLVCTAFNADFDGDQMPVHVPLSIEAQTEARYLMLASNNILKLSDGKPVVTPTQDMVMGCYYLTIYKDSQEDVKRRIKDEDGNFVLNEDGTFKVKELYYCSEDEAEMAYNNGEIDLQSLVHIRVSREWTNPEGENETVTGIILTTVGKVIFNRAIPQDLGYVDRSKKENAILNEIDFLVGKKQLGNIVEMCYRAKGASGTAEVLDKIKALGFKYSTIGAVTASVFDMHIPEAKKGILKDADFQVRNIEDLFSNGYITDFERYSMVVDVWKKATDDVTEKLKEGLSKFNPIYMMSNSGARGNLNQMRQLSGMRGLMTDPKGKTIELPVKACFREGLTVLEYFISSHGGRKGLADTALKTADSGYLTRRLVDVAQDVTIREEDCSAGSKASGLEICALTGDNKDEIIEKLGDRIAGKFTIEDVVNPLTGEVIVPADQMITDPKAELIDSIAREYAAQTDTHYGDYKVLVRTVLTCRSKKGICAKCYGKNMATGEPVTLGEAVGTIAAQSIGEPGTQLTMRTFHTGGVATSDDITQGLPRVEELFENRRPKGVALLCEVGGMCSVKEIKDKREVVITQTNDVEKSYSIPYSAKLKVKDGEVIEAGTPLTGGPIFPLDLLRTRGIKTVQEYLVKEVQSVYRLQGIEINDKHVEVIVRQMLKKVKVEDAGDTNLLPGELVEQYRFEEENERTINNGGRPAAAKRTLLGITKASLATESFLSAAAFQETSKVLTEAAIKSKIDPLFGLKENIIIGKLISAGTGFKKYKNCEVKPVIEGVQANSNSGNGYLDLDEEDRQSDLFDDSFMENEDSVENDLTNLNEGIDKI
ncbi:MAG: DNA-directed RNA polymerase subunit beta' [Clostridia bacterium]|nr:DNA-directed RNA polymerase subunit beta' [Clostridia bacterium]